jgi:hypothetical protein
MRDSTLDTLASLCRRLVPAVVDLVDLDPPVNPNRDYRL